MRRGALSGSHASNIERKFRGNLRSLEWCIDEVQWCLDEHERRESRLRRQEEERLRHTELERQQVIAKAHSASPSLHIGARVLIHDDAMGWGKLVEVQVTGYEGPAVVARFPNGRQHKIGFSVEEAARKARRAERQHVTDRAFAAEPSLHIGAHVLFHDGGKIHEVVVVDYEGQAVVARFPDDGKKYRPPLRHAGEVA